jgi:hypothetical protein
MMRLSTIEFSANGDIVRGDLSEKLSNISLRKFYALGQLKLP